MFRKSPNPDAANGQSNPDASAASPGTPFGPATRIWIQVARAHVDLVATDLQALGLDATEASTDEQSCYLKVQRPDIGPDAEITPACLPQHPYIQRLWREDYLWPGALHHDDFISKCAAGIAKRWTNRGVLHTTTPHIVDVGASFRDRSHLCSRLRQAIAAEFAKDKGKPPTPAAGAGALPLSLCVLLTPKAVVASFLPIDGRQMNLDIPAPWRAKLRGVTFPSRAAHKCLAALATGFGSGLWAQANPQATEPQTSGPHDQPLLGQTWIDAGACPGGMTAALLALGARVIALDRAPLDTQGMPGSTENLFFHQCDARTVNPNALCARAGIHHANGLVCDINGSVPAAAQAVQNLAPRLGPQIPILFTLKLKQPRHWRSSLAEAKEKLAAIGIELLSARHFSANRHELTLLARSPSSPVGSPSGHKMPSSQARVPWLHST